MSTTTALFFAALLAPSSAAVAPEAAPRRSGLTVNGTDFTFASDPNSGYPGVPPPTRASAPSAIDLTEAKHHVLLAQASYCSQEQITAWSCPACDELTGVSSPHYLYDSTWKLQGYVARDDDQSALVVSFRGSENVANWISNLNFGKTNPYSDYPDAWVHSGFYNDWLALKTDVLAALAQLAAESGYSSVVFVGHSLGASMATLGAFDVAREGTYSVASIWTAGSPRTGDAGFATAVGTVLGAMEHRLTHYYDMVPHVPETFLGFWHAATEYWIAEANDAAKTCDGSGEDGACSNSCSPFSCTSVDDHLNYLGVPMGSAAC